MPRSRCVLAVSLLATLAVAACSTVVRKRAPIDDYNDYQNDDRDQYQTDYQDQQYQSQYQDQQYQKQYQDQYQYQDRAQNEYNNFQPVVSFGPVVVKKEPQDEQDFSKIPGIPGVDYPIYHTVPSTSFSCAHVPIVPGMYANVETGCQAYHICHDGREGHQGASFLCTNGTLFNQNLFACDWWYNVNCADAPSLYRLNADPLKNPYVPKEQKDEIRRRFKIAVE